MRKKALDELGAYLPAIMARTERRDIPVSFLALFISFVFGLHPFPCLKLEAGTDYHSVKVDISGLVFYAFTFEAYKPKRMSMY
jgi:hypothetical protein